MILLTFPSDVRSNFDGYDYLLNIIEITKSLHKSLVVFDFSGVSFFQGNLSAIFGVCLEILTHNGNKMGFVNAKPEIELILRRNGFLVQLGYTPAEDEFSTTLKYTKFVPDDDEAFKDYILSGILNKKEFPAVSPLVFKKILGNIFEIYENARTHGKCDFIHACGQFFPKSHNKPLHFTLVDKGLNIKENVSQFLGIDIDAANAIEWAMVKGHTTKIDQSGGLGLALIFSFIKLNLGKIQIVSADGFYEFSDGNARKRKFDNYFEGTIVTIIFNFNDKKSYRLKGEKRDLSNPF